MLTSLRICVFSVASVALYACAGVGPNYAPPETSPSQKAFVDADRLNYAAQEPHGSQTWWEYGFDDPLLTALIETAETANFDLEAQLARVEAADALSKASARALLPQGGVSAAYQRLRPGLGSNFSSAPTGADGQPAAPQARAFDTYSAEGQLAWEIDLFGRLRRQSQQQSARADAEAALLQDLVRLTRSRLASAYFNWVESAMRHQVARNNLATQNDALALTEKLFEFGEVAAFDVERQRTQARQTEAQAAALALARSEALSAIAFLTGQTVPDLTTRFPALMADAEAPETLPALNAILPFEDPTAMLRRRPDVAAAERRLAAATYGVGVEVAGLFPQLSLVGNASLTALSLDGLTSTNALGYNYGPSLSWSVFSIPATLARAEAADKTAAAALASYRGAVLNALTETDAAISRYAQSTRRAAILNDAQQSAARSLLLAQARYREGADSLLTFLDSQRTALAVEDQFIAAAMAARRARVDVHAALAQ